MSFLLTALADRPQALYMMDDTTPFQDYSGYNRNATASATPVRYLPLVRGTTFSQYFSSTVVGTFASPVFAQGQELNSFTLEAWLFPSIMAADYQQLLGNLNQMDGLVIFSTAVHFVTKYADGSEARVSYELGDQRRAYVVAVHTSEKNALYVDGELVDEIAITDAQRASQYSSAATDLTSGTTASAQRTALGGIGIYDYALTGNTIAQHYEAGLMEDDAVTQFNGDIIPLSIETADVFLDQSWNDEDDWYEGRTINVKYANDRLTPQFSGNVSMPGQWLTVVPIYVANTTSAYGMMFTWEGTGVTVEASNNGVGWETVVNGRRSTQMAVGTDPTGKQTQLRVTFAGGITNDTSYIKNLRVVCFRTNTTQQVAGRTVTYTNALPQYPRYPTEYRSDWGAWLQTATHTLTLSDDVVDATPIRSLGIWIKKTTSTNPVISVSGTQYINGVQSAATLVNGHWTLMHIVLAADHTGPVTITGPAQVGQIGVYSTALSAQDIADIAAAYFGNNVTRVTDASVVGVAESTNAAQIYAHDWTIQASG